MKSWSVSEAKARLSEVVGGCAEEPQILYNRRKPVAVLIDIEEYEAFRRFREARAVPSMSNLLGELENINAREDDLEPPERRDRPVPDLTD